MAESPSPWVVVLKRDEPEDPWGRSVPAGSTWFMAEAASVESGWPEAAPQLLIIRSHSHKSLDLSVPLWLDRARVWCHFGNNNSDHPSLDGARIQQELWSETRTRLFRGDVPELLVNPFSSSDRRLAWDHKLAELGCAISTAIRRSAPLSFDLSSLGGPWSCATRRYYQDLVHLRMLEAVRPLYLRKTDEVLSAEDVEGLALTLNQGGLSRCAYAHLLLRRIPTGASLAVADLEALFAPLCDDPNGPPDLRLSIGPVGRSALDPSSAERLAISSI